MSFALPRAGSRSRSAARRARRRRRGQVRSRLPTKRAWALPAGSRPHGTRRRSASCSGAQARTASVSAQVRRSRRAGAAREVEMDTGFKTRVRSVGRGNVQAKRHVLCERSAYRSCRPRRNVRADRRLDRVGIEPAPGEQRSGLAARSEPSGKRRCALALRIECCYGSRRHIALDPPPGEVVQDRLVSMAARGERLRSCQGEPAVVHVADAFERLDRLCPCILRDARLLEAGVELVP